VLETALNQEMTEHLDHEKHGPAGNEAGNVRNGTRSKTALTESTGEVSVEVPQDRAGTFEGIRRRAHPVLAHGAAGHTRRLGSLQPGHHPALQRSP
jgi:transposase-like protein